MSTKYSPKITTNGLVLCLDAANPKSYTSGSLIWNDLSGNNYSGSLISGAYYTGSNGGSIVFDGTNDYVNTLMNINFSTADYSLESIVYPTFDVATYGRPILAKNEIGGCAGFDFGLEFGRTTNKFDILIDNSNLVYTTNTYLKNNWYHVLATRKNLGVGSYLYNLYINNVLDGTLTGNYFGGNGGKMAVGFYVSCGVVNPWMGNISLVRVYNRALTQLEITQNYNAMKGRYGL